MIRTLTVFFLLFSINSFGQNILLEKMDNAFDLDLQIDKVDTELYAVTVTIDLKNENYVISPFSKDDTYMHFGVFISENDNFRELEKLSEEPNSVEEFDSILKEKVKFVREKTTYKKHIRVLKQDDFEVNGMVEFLLEPSCKPYVIEFKISQKSGKMKIQKTKTRYHESYKGK